MDVVGLSLQDQLAVQELKYLRQRSMRTPGWRDVGYLLKFIKPSYIHWDREGPLESLRTAAERACADALRNNGFRPPPRDDLWLDVCASVDRLIEGAEAIAGQRIKPRP